MQQPVPKVNRIDLERIVRREFSGSDYDAIMTILNEYGRDDWQRESVRVQLAVLKLAQGDLNKVRSYIELAKCDYRDVLAPAEYPGYIETVSKLSVQEKKKIIEEDWQQYVLWLKK